MTSLVNTRIDELSPDEAARYMGMVRRSAHKLARRLPSHVNVDDLIGAGMVGLADALRRRKASGDHFDAYADFRIRGAMLDELRSNDPLSRDLRELNKRVAATVQDLTQRLGRPPEEAEIAAAIGISLDQLRDKMTTLSFRGHVALDTTGSKSADAIDLKDEQSEGAEMHMLRAERRARLAKEVDWLPTRLRQVLKLYYEDECTLREIGELLGVTESRISQLHADAIARLRAACTKASMPPPSLTNHVASGQIPACERPAVRHAARPSPPPRFPAGRSTPPAPLVYGASA